MRTRHFLAVGVAAMTLAGCANVQSQIAQLQPVAGDALTSVNVAVIDVLLEQGVEVLVAPVCSYEPTTYTCAGSTTAGQPISATAEGAEPESVTITVGGDKIFTGSIADVLTKAGRR